MTTIEIARKMVELNRQGRGLDALQTLFSDDMVSVEAAAMEGMDREAKGKAAVIKKGEWWFSNHEVHAFEASDPWPHGDRFIVRYKIDVTHKPSGQRMQMEEAGLYTVQKGKIVREEFFYDMGG